MFILELTHWKRPWYWKRLKAGGEGDDRGWDDWMASPTRWTWVWVNSGSWWWTGRPGVLQFMGSQRVGHDWATELNWRTNKESWAPKNWYFWTVVLEKTLESPLDCKEIQLVHPKGDQSWVFIERTDVEAETPILWPSDAKSWLIGQDPDAGQDWRRKEKGMTEDEMVGWTTDLMDMSLSKRWEMVKDREAWCPVVHGVAKSRTWLSDWTELKDK